MKKKILLNTTTSILLQMTTLICGLILPRLILGQYGSVVNGLVQSITQFLNVITFVELGVGQVVQSALYRPLLEEDWSKVSSILASGGKFFRKIAYALTVYVLVLLVLYPKITDTSFDWAYTAALIGAISISSFARYYFGIIDRLLLSADQKGYIQYITQIGCLIVNTIVCVVMIHCGSTIQLVKLVSSIVFLLQPLTVRAYVCRHYRIDRKIQYDGEPIRQKWNGIAQHIGAVVLDNTDTVVLTVMSTLENVSIYSVYHLVVHGVRSIYSSATAGIQSAMGKLWAQQDRQQLERAFGTMETVLHFSVVFLFSCAGILIGPFVQVYTSGVTDVEYIQPLFALLIVLAYGSQCLKTPYNILVMAAGHYKQTQSAHIVSAAINVIVTVASVHLWGLVGVAIGTLAAMLYQTLWLAWYVCRHLIEKSFATVLVQLLVDVGTGALIWTATGWIRLMAENYLAWFVMALEVAAIALLITGAVALLLCRKRIAGIRQLLGKAR